jgi:hypothetical protein
MLLPDIITKMPGMIGVFWITMPRKPRRCARFPRNSSHLAFRSVEFAARWATSYVECDIESRYRMLREPERSQKGERCS